MDRRLASPSRLGVLHGLEVTETHFGRPPMFVGHGRYARPIVRTASGAVRPVRHDGELRCSGKGTDAASCLVATIGEGIERYCAGCVDLSRTFEGTWARLGDRAIAPQEFLGSAVGEHAAGAYLAHRTMRWIGALDVLGQAERLVPASVVWLFHEPFDGCDPFVDTTSNGLAAGPSIEAAALGGVCELLERDAFMLYWLARKAPPSVPTDALPRETRALVERYVAAHGCRATFFMLEADHGVPVVLASIASDREPHPAIGCACSLSVDQALSKALLEALQTLLWVDYMRRQERRAVAADEIRTFEDHVRYYFDPAREPEQAFLFSGREMPADRFTRLRDDGESLERSLATPEAKLGEICQRLRRLGHDVLLVDLSQEPFIRCGFHVARVIAPGLQRMTVQVPGLASRRRAAAFFRALGGDLPADFPNPAPHPFP